MRFKLTKVRDKNFEEYIEINDIEDLAHLPKDYLFPIIIYPSFRSPGYIDLTVYDGYCENQPEYIRAERYPSVDINTDKLLVEMKKHLEGLTK